jgi:tRNA A-37 threonylcarbamoyl transferase component Bud32
MTACQHCGTTFDASSSGRFCPACGRAFRSSHETGAEPWRSAGGGDPTGSAGGAGVSPRGIDPLLGAVIDGLRFDAVLGRGMTGCVYRATQLALERPLAIKVPTLALAGDDTAVRRFRREALALARISHPGVVAVNAVGDMPDGRPYLAIEFLDGQSLEHAIAAPNPPAPDGGPARPDIVPRLGHASQAMPIARAVDLALQIAEALAEIHARDLVHRDLKPDNVMLVRPQVGGDRAVLIDFGIALPVASADATRLTAGGGLVGTPHYMAPEQVQGDDIDGRADIYALGATLYRILTGTVPFDGSGVEVVVAHLARSVRPVRELAPAVPAALEAIVMKCLAKRVSDRWENATQLARALAEVATGAAADPVRAPRAKRLSASPPARATARAATGRPERDDADARDADDPAPPPAARARRRGTLAITGAAVAIAIGAGVAFAIGAGGSGDSDGAARRGGSAGDVATLTPDAAVVEPPLTRTRALVVDDGGLSMRVVVPEQIAVGESVRFALEIWDADGAPVAAPEVVVTIEREVDPGAAAGAAGEARGFAATRAGMGRSVFAFSTRFATAGRYKLRVFPPVGDATFVVDLDVAPN